MTLDAYASLSCAAVLLAAMPAVVAARKAWVCNRIYRDSSAFRNRRRLLDVFKLRRDRRRLRKAMGLRGGITKAGALTIVPIVVRSAAKRDYLQLRRAAQWKRRPRMRMAA